MAIDGLLTDEEFEREKNKKFSFLNDKHHFEIWFKVLGIIPYFYFNKVRDFNAKLYDRIGWTVRNRIRCFIRTSKFQINLHLIGRPWYEKEIGIVSTTLQHKG